MFERWALSINNNNNNNSDNLYGAVTQPCRYKGASQSANNRVGLREQISLESGFEGVNCVGRSQGRRKTVPASGAGRRESAIAKAGSHPSYAKIAFVEQSKSQPGGGRMCPNTEIAQILRCDPKIYVVALLSPHHGNCKRH